MNIRIREPTHSEFLEVANFSFEHFVSETAVSSGESVNAIKEKLGGPPINRSGNDIWLLVEQADKRIGFVWFQIIQKDNSAFGWDIFLEPEHRSKGIGRFVMQSCGKELVSRGVQFAKICVFEHNQIARKLYESLGFTVENFDEQRRQFTLVLNVAELKLA